MTDFFTEDGIVRPIGESSGISSDDMVDTESNTNSIERNLAYAKNLNDKAKKKNKGKKYYNSLSDDAKRNVIASFTGIKPEHVDLSDLEYDDLDKWTRKGLDDMAETKQDDGNEKEENSLPDKWICTTCGEKFDGLSAAQTHEDENDYHVVKLDV